MHKPQARMQSIGKATTQASFPQGVNYLLVTYATNEKIAEREGEITIFTQPPNKTPL